MLISWQGEPYFNPRSRVGNDPAPFTIAATPDISIHVPAWGTTSLTFPQGRQYSYFNPRSRVGNDQGRNMRLLLMFDFNPRSRVGNDGRARPLSDGWCISIHVPAWGTTAIPCRSCPVSVFQSTFPRGERLQISTIFHLYICISSTNSHFSITSFCIFYLIHFFLICFFQLFMVRIFWGFSVYFWFALYRNNT